MTTTQWEALLAASRGAACKPQYHGKTLASLEREGLVEFRAGEGLVPTILGRNRLYERYPAGSIGPFGAEKETP